MRVQPPLESTNQNPTKTSPLDKVQRRLARQMGLCITSWGLVKPGDHLMVAVSGGKDSYSLLELLLGYQRRAPIEFSLTAVHLDQRQPGYDGAPLRQWLQQRQIPHQILSEDTYSTVLKNTEPGKSYCSVCSRMRRGILYTTAHKLGCNKIALGHHRDDALETLLMNMFFGGRMQAMPAIYRTDDQSLEVIRPLIECAEADLAHYSQLRGHPILPCNLCGSQSGLQRQEMKKLLNQLSDKHPQLRASMLGALKNVRPSHLLDPKLAHKETAPGQVSPDNSGEARPQGSSDLVQLRLGG